MIISVAYKGTFSRLRTMNIQIILEIYICQLLGPQLYVKMHDSKWDTLMRLCDYCKTVKLIYYPVIRNLFSTPEMEKML